MDIDGKIEILRKSLESRSKESIISDICNEASEYNIGDLFWTFDIQIDED